MEKNIGSVEHTLSPELVKELKEREQQKQIKLHQSQDMKLRMDHCMCTIQTHTYIQTAKHRRKVFLLKCQGSHQFLRSSGEVTHLRALVCLLIEVFEEKENEVHPVTFTLKWEKKWLAVRKVACQKQWDFILKIRECKSLGHVEFSTVHLQGAPATLRAGGAAASDRHHIRCPAGEGGARGCSKARSIGHLEMLRCIFQGNMLCAPK